MGQLLHEDITDGILRCAIEVHRHLGPGLLESAYEECLAREFEYQSIAFTRQVSLPLFYKDRRVDCAYVMDFLVGDMVIVELKAVAKTDPIHIAQLMTYMRIARKQVGLLINFNVPILKDGVTRRAL